MYLDLMYEIALLTCSSMVVKSDYWVMTSPGQSIIFPPAVSLVMRFYVFCGLMSHTALAYVDLIFFSLSLWKMNSIVLVPEFFSVPGTCDQLCCTFSWSIPVHPSWLVFCIQKNFFHFFSRCGFPSVLLWLYISFLGVCKQSILCLCLFLFFLSFPLETI